MTKEQKIKEAYGEYYSQCKPDENGWSTYDSWFKYIGNKIDYEYSDNRIMNIRPKSLSGIETNNGWDKIESEKDLPDITGENIIFYRNGLTTTYPSEDVSEDKKTYLKYSHFKIRTKELNPIY